MSRAEALRNHLRGTLREEVANGLASRALAARETVGSGCRDLDRVVGGFPRGAITELVGEASSGRSSLVLGSLARMTSQGECCAYIDASDAFDPVAARQAGIQLSNLLWVRCASRAERAWRATDVVLQGGGFGSVVLDLCDVPHPELRCMPPSTWYRFRDAVEKAPTLLLVLARLPLVRSCAALSLALEQERTAWAGLRQAHQLLRGLHYRIAPRKPTPGQPISAYATVRE